MSDETPETPAERADAAAARPRPANPSAAAARRARQMGTRRPSPTPRADATEVAAPAEVAATTPTTDPATEPSTEPVATTAAAKAAPPRRRPSPGPTAAKPASSVGKKARPRPRPTPAAEEPVEAPAGPDEGEAPARWSRRLVGAGVVLSVLLVAVGAVFLVLTLVAKPAISQEETDRAVSAAKSDVALVTSYGYQTVDSDAAKAAAVLTGQFKQQYLDSIKTVVKPQLPTSQTVSTGQVDTAGLVSADSKGRQVVVLVYGQQSVTNKAQTTPRIDAFQIRVTMQLVDGTWLVSQLEQLGNNA